VNQPVFKLVVDFGKAGNLLFGTAGRQVLEKAVCLYLLHFIPLIFQYHPCQLLAVDELFYPIPAIMVTGTGSPQTEKPGYPQTEQQIGEVYSLHHLGEGSMLPVYPAKLPCMKQQDN